MRLTVRDPRARVGVVGVPLRIQVVQKHVHFVLRQQRRHGLHVVVAQAVVVRVRVLAVEHGMMVRHPPRLVRRCHLHVLCLSVFTSKQRLDLLLKIKKIKKV